MTQDIHFRGNHEQLRKLLWSFVGALSGRSGGYQPYVRGIKLRVGMVALGCVQESFVAKAAGGSGEDGIQWAPLKKETIANRRVGQGDVAGLKAQGIVKRKYGYGARTQGPQDLDKRGRLKRGFLTAEQDKRWRKIFATRKAQMMAQHGMGEEAAAGRAAQIAWAILKQEGAKTKLEVLGGRHVQIGRDSGRLFSSLSPGIAEPLRHPLLQAPPDAPEPADRILREDPGAVIVGSAVVYAGTFHAKRPLWPANGQLPEAWNERIGNAAKTGVLEAVAMILQGQG